VANERRDSPGQSTQSAASYRKHGQVGWELAQFLLSQVTDQHPGSSEQGDRSKDIDQHKGDVPLVIVKEWIWARELAWWICCSVVSQLER